MSPDLIAEIDPLELPPSLERVERGIRVTGHRVSLFQVLDAMLDGASLERLREKFPTVPPWKLEEVLSFCKRHMDLMRRYHAEQRETFEAGVGQRVSEAPSLEHWRRRRVERSGQGRRND